MEDEDAAAVADAPKAKNRKAKIRLASSRILLGRGGDYLKRVQYVGVFHLLQNREQGLRARRNMQFIHQSPTHDFANTAVTESELYLRSIECFCKKTCYCSAFPCFPYD